VLDPLKVTITNYEGEELVEIENNAEAEVATNRSVPFGREIYIEQEDFMMDAPKKFFRLTVGNMVRLKGAYIIRCDEAITDPNGNVIELLCTYFPESKSGNDTSGLQAKGVLHWVPAKHAVQVEVRLYDRLFTEEDVDGAEGDFKDYINPNSLQTVTNALAEPAIREATLEDRFQFLRKGYFCLDKDSTASRLVFNRTATLKDSWSKEMKK